MAWTMHPWGGHCRCGHMRCNSRRSGRMCRCRSSPAPAAVGAHGLWMQAAPVPPCPLLKPLVPSLSHCASRRPASAKRQGQRQRKRGKHADDKGERRLLSDVSSGARSARPSDLTKISRGTSPCVLFSRRVRAALDLQKMAVGPQLLRMLFRAEGIASLQRRTIANRLSWQQRQHNLG